MIGNEQYDAYIHEIRTLAKNKAGDMKGLMERDGLSAAEAREEMQSHGHNMHEFGRLDTFRSEARTEMERALEDALAGDPEDVRAETKALIHELMDIGRISKEQTRKNKG